MNIIEEIENRIYILTSHIKLSKTQLQANEKGERELSLMAKASAELSIQKNSFLLNKYKQKLSRLKAQDLTELLEYEKVKAETRKHNYYKYQMLRIKHDKTKTEKEKAETFFIINDIPEDVQLEDSDLFDISHKSTLLYLKIHSELDDELIEIKNEFLKLVENHFDKSNSELKLLNYRIPIIILQLRVLLQNIKENIKDENLKEFQGFPKFEDWWIQELWTSHQAYMGLFKWKKIILNLFITTEQKKAFKIIFQNWILIKRILNVKGETAYFYNYAFDKMIQKYAELEDEQDKKNLDSLKNILENVTKEENFLSVSKNHNIITSYMKFKIKKSKPKEKEDKKK